VTTLLRRLLALAAVVALALLGLDALEMHAYRYQTTERQVRLQGEAALKHIAQRERTHPAAALIRRQRRAALEAKGYVVHEEFVLSGFTVRTQKPKPADSVVTRLADWIYPQLRANAWDCWDDNNDFMDGCDDGGGDGGDGAYVDMYPYDTGDPNTTGLESESCDDYGACNWDDAEFDNSAGDGDAQSVIDSLRASWDAYFHRRVNPAASFLGMPCSADGDPTHMNPDIGKFLILNSLSACIAAGEYMAVYCVGSGPAYLACLGEVCGYAGVAAYLTQNGLFVGACHP
jgi:hypothetical protein